MVVLLAVLPLALGSQVWLRWLGRFLVVTDPLRPVDAVVALGGGERVKRRRADARMPGPWLAD